MDILKFLPIDAVHKQHFALAFSSSLSGINVCFCSIIGKERSVEPKVAMIRLVLSGKCLALSKNSCDQL